MIPGIILSTIGDFKIKNSYIDWRLILNNKENTPPTPKTNYVNIEGGDGSLDLSEAFGEVKYNDRTITYTFSMMDNFKDLPSKISEVANFIHGRKFEIKHYDDSDYYYIGRLSINEFKVDRARGTFTVEAICEPYKYKKYVTVHEATVNGELKLLCPNEKKRVVPTITISSEMTVVFEKSEYVLSAGTYEILNIEFKEGINELTFKGNGDIHVSYQEASL